MKLLEKSKAFHLRKKKEEAAGHCRALYHQFFLREIYAKMLIHGITPLQDCTETVNRSLLKKTTEGRRRDEEEVFSSLYAHLHFVLWLYITY